MLRLKVRNIYGKASEINGLEFIGNCLKMEQSKLKVAVIASSMRIIGGQSIQANRLVEAFVGNESIKMAFLPNNPETIFQKIKILRTIFASIKFWRLLFADIPKFDIVQVFSSATSGYILASIPPLVVSKIFRKRVILNYHSGELEDHIVNWKRTAFPTMKKFDSIVVPSQFLVDVFAKYGLKATAIYNFIESDKFKFRERETLQPIFLSNRNFEVHYNVSCVIRAFSLIQQRYPKAHLTIAGFGTEESTLKKLVSGLNLKNVEFVGKVSNEEMPKLYDNADIYLNSSIVDNMPLSIIEAFSAGTAVVSSKTGGIPYILEDGKTGLLVEMNDCEKLAERAMFLLENQDFAKKMIANARQEVVKYSWENVQDQWIKFYSDHSKENSPK
jgi:glycosyltransferase involved in cell wall biosynthesis